MKCASLACVFSFYPSLYAPFWNPLDFSFACLAFFLCYAQCCHGDGSGVRHVHYEVPWPFAVLSGYCVGNCLRLFKIYCCHDDGSDGRHVCTKYRGHTYYCQATMLVIVIN